MVLPLDYNCPSSLRLQPRASPRHGDHMHPSHLLNEGCKSPGGSVSVNKGARARDSPLESGVWQVEGQKAKTLFRAGPCQPLPPWGRELHFSALPVFICRWGGRHHLRICRIALRIKLDMELLVILLTLSSRMHSIGPTLNLRDFSSLWAPDLFSSSEGSGPITDSPLMGPGAADRDRGSKLGQLSLNKLELCLRRSPCPHLFLGLRHNLRHHFSLSTL